MLKGIIPMTYCFFNKNNSIDMQAMRDQISLITRLGSHGIACLGLATEVNKLNLSEKKFSGLNVLSVAPMLAEAIKRNYENRSISSLFY